jgi:hypothetical protein
MEMFTPDRLATLAAAEWGWLAAAFLIGTLTGWFAFGHRTTPS